MTITVETGAIVTGANSYVSIADCQTFATARGVDLTGQTSAQMEAYLLKAMDYIEAKRDRFQGFLVDEDQPLQFPRYDVWVDGFYVESTTIPQILINAQCQLVMDAYSGETLQPNRVVGASGDVIRQKAGSVEVEYSATKSPTTKPLFRAAENWLKPLYKLQTNGFIRA